MLLIMMMLNSKLTIPVIHLMYFTFAASENVVVTAQGKLQGSPRDGHIAYTGIPYATAKDDARFKCAGLAPFWVGIKESATTNCYPTSEVNECLQLDVHVPTSGSAPWPVIVWIRGGTGQYHPEKLVKQGVIVIVVYHRLGPVGFLCLSEEEIPGNSGAKDVVLALRWIRDNIVAFRGNPAKVIVAGQGFGAAMVEALTVSPMAQGLFHGVILQSGTVLSPWAFNYDAEDRAQTIGTTIGDDDRDVSSVLLHSDIASLVTTSEKLDIPYYPFGLCVEDAYEKEERFLIDSPIDLLSRKRNHPVPMIIGYNSDEAYIFVSNIKGARVLRRISKDVSFLLPDELKFLNERERAQVARQISDMYFKNNVTMASVLAYHRDAYFLNHIHRSVRLHALNSHLPVHFYQFSHVGSLGIQSQPGVKKTGAAHSDELAYLFSGRDLDGDDGNVQQKLVKLWANFAKYLTPTPKLGDSSTWDPVEAHNPRLLNIDKELKVEQFPHKKAMQMWDDIYEKYYYSRYRASQS